MQKPNRPFFLFAVLALVAASTLALGAAFAGDDGAAKPASPTVTDAATAERGATKTLSPVHSMMAFVAEQVCGDVESPCPSCPKAEAAWRKWFDGGKDVPLASLRDRLVADGWTADRYVGYFKEMAAAHAKQAGECGSCDGSCDGCDKDGAASAKDCSGGCDKAGKADKGCCGGCDKAGKADKGCCGGCDKAEKGCTGCPGKQAQAPETEPTAAK